MKTGKSLFDDVAEMYVTVNFSFETYSILWLPLYIESKPEFFHLSMLILIWNK